VPGSNRYDCGGGRRRGRANGSRSGAPTPGAAVRRHGKKAPTRDPAAASFPRPSGVYVVQTGESLADVALKICMTEGQLLSSTGIRNRDFIFEGRSCWSPPPAVGCCNKAARAQGTVDSSVGIPPAIHLKVRASGAPWRAQPYRGVPARERLTGAPGPIRSPVPV